MYRFLKESGFSLVEGEGGLCVGLSPKARQELTRIMSQSYIDAATMAKLLLWHNVCLQDAAAVTPEAHKLCPTCVKCPECARIRGAKEVLSVIKEAATVAYLGVAVNMSSRMVWFRDDVAIAAVPVEVEYAVSRQLKRYRATWIDVSNEMYTIEGDVDIIYSALRSLNLITSAANGRDAVARTLILYERLGYAKRV